MVIKILLMALFFVLFCTGCNTVQIKYVNVPVQIPCPEPPKIKRPILELNSIPITAAAPAEVIGAYTRTVEQLKGHAIELETILNGYRP